MPDALILSFAALASLAGMAWLALAMDVHWGQVRHHAQPRGAARRLRALGVLALAGSLALCLRVDHASMASLVWVMTLAGSALAVALTLTWQPAWLRPLAWVGEAGR